MRRILFFIALLAIIFVQVPAQTTALWIKDSQTGSYDFSEGKRMVIHPNGSVYVIGQLGGTLTFDGQTVTTPPNIVVQDAFLARYSSDGTLIWVKQIMQSTHMTANTVVDLKIDSQGDLIFVGFSNDLTSVLGGSPGKGSFIAKVDADANLRWINYESNVSIENYQANLKGNKLVIDQSDNIFWYSDQNLEPSWDNFVGGLALIKYAPDGTKIFNKYITRNSTYYHPQLASVSIDGEGNLIVSGGFTGWINFNGKTLYSSSNSSYQYLHQLFVAKISSNGDLMWVLNSINGSDSGVYAHATDLDGSSYLTIRLGEGTQFGKGFPSFHSGSYLVKVDKNGNTQWMNPIINGAPNDVFLGTDGNIYMSGMFFKNFAYQSYHKHTSGSQAFVLKINKSGDLLGSSAAIALNTSTAIPNSSSSSGYQAVTDSQGDIYMLGYFWTGMTYGCLNATTGGMSFFLVKLNGITPALPMTITGPSFICEAGTVSLVTESITGIQKYKWFLPTGATPTSGSTETSTNSIQVALTSQTNNQLILVSVDTCANYSDGAYSVNIKSVPSPPKFSASKNQVCSGTSVPFAVEDDVNTDQYTWSPPANATINSTASRDSVKLIFASTFQQGDLKVNAKNACGESNTTFSINVFPVPAKPDFSGNLAICSYVSSFSQSITPVADAVGYDWQIPALTSRDSRYPSNAPSIHLQISPAFVSGDIRVTAIGHCVNSDPSDSFTLSRIKKPGPALNLSGPDQICADNTPTTTYQIQPIENVSKYVWKVSGSFTPNGKVLTTANTLQLKPTGPGINTIKVYGVNSCGEQGDSTSFNSTSFKMLRTPLLEKETCDRILRASNADAPTWYFNGQPISGAGEMELTVIDSGVYYVQVNNFCGVKESERIQMYPVASVENIFFPNVITPNADGKNDFFKIDKSLENSSLLIIDRWGIEVFSSNSYQNEWSGYNVDPGVYFYQLKNNCLSQSIKGWISVLK